jgi:hypothetical protein
MYHCSSLGTSWSVPLSVCPVLRALVRVRVSVYPLTVSLCVSVPYVRESVHTHARKLVRLSVSRLIRVSLSPDPRKLVRVP